MELKVLNREGQETGKTIELSESVWSVEPNDHAIYLDVKRYMGGLRQGTHKAKERSEITGSTKKLRRQKGSGAARVGDIKSPIFRGGGRIFGPRPRLYDMKINKKVKQLARKSALSYKVKDGALIVIEDFDFEGPKTKEYTSVLKGLALKGKKALHIVAEYNENVAKSARNLDRVKYLTADKLNTYEVLNHQVLIISEQAIKQIEEQYN